MSKSSDAKRAKTQLQLLPPLPLELIALCMQQGAGKYGVANWRETGIQASDYIGACMRHLQAWANGENLDLESGQPHLAHLGACVMVMLDALAYGAMEDDRPYRDRRPPGPGQEKPDPLSLDSYVNWRKQTPPDPAPALSAHYRTWLSQQDWSKPDGS